jgi:mannose-P-dolichol utilization defect protein 1
MEAVQSNILDPLKPYLQPITSSLPAPVNNAIISLIGSPCHSALVLDLDVTKAPACVSLAISKALGLAIVSASAIVKVPQILKLIDSRSSAGVSFVSYALETASLLITLSYNVRQRFPFSTYGESALIAVQDVVVGVLVLTFAGKSAAAAAFVAVVAASVYALLFNDMLVDAQTMGYLQAGAGLLGVASKAPQIYTIWKEGGTGQLSAFAVFNYLLGSLSRIFTTLQEVDDKIILYSFIAAFSLNAILAAQMVYYWNSPATPKEQRDQSRKATEKPASAESSGYSRGSSARKPTTRRKA